jgi:Mg-chelatase subunit ChlD
MRAKILGAAALVAVTMAGDALAAPAAKPAKQPQIEVAFVLDTTGSMGGLIAGAKAKIWWIANQLISARPTPKIKIGLVAYRDRGDEYVTRVFDLSEDIDAVYANLQQFQAGGGGDTPESVNQALYEAVTKLTWSPSKDVLKVLFLVGDCPPHMDYPDDVKYQKTCELAVKKDLVINTVQCGGESSTTPIWQEIASLSEGSFAAIGQTGDVQVVETPMDAELAKLNVAVGKTLVPYGAETEQKAVVAKQRVAEAAPAAEAADRLAYNTASGVAVQGGGDLVDAVNAGYIKPGELKRDQLPPEMQKLNATEQKAYLDKKMAERAAIQKQIAELTAKRKAYMDEEMRRLAGEGKGDAFDVKVAQTLKMQAQKKGIQYGTPVQPTSPPEPARATAVPAKGK